MATFVQVSINWYQKPLILFIFLIFQWFLSGNRNADTSRIIEQLKYKADYLYAQMEYSEALKYYEELLPLIPASNTVLRQEVCEARVMSLIKMDATEDAEKCLKEMVQY